MKTSELLTIDGSRGEGGGQILRTSLAMALVLQRPVRLQRIRAGRRRPGLLRQHLTAARAAAEVCGGELSGAELGATELTLRPGETRAGDLRFAVGSAGSATLVLHTVLPPLLRAPGPSTLLLEGGTHNPMAPPFEHLQRVFLPLLERMGARVEATLLRHGFYPAGGGRLRVRVRPPRGPLQPLVLEERGALIGRQGVAVVANLPRHVGERELRRVRQRLGWPAGDVELREVDSDGPGNMLALELESEQITELVACFGEKGLRAERVADRAVGQARRYLEAGVPVGEHLADQLLLPLALAGAGRFRTLGPSSHLRTNREVIRAFLPGVQVELDELGADDWRVTVGG